MTQAQLIPPITVRIEGTVDAADFQATTFAITGTEVTKTLLFATEARQVITHGYEAATRQRLLLARAMLEPFLELPALTLPEDGNYIKESIVEGLPFHFADHRSRDRAFRSLLRSYVTLAEQRSLPPESGRSIDELLATVYEHVRSHAFGEILATHRAEIRDVLAAAPSAPSHGDLHGDNVLVGQDGPRIIDLDEFAVRPFFFDLFTLPLHRTAKTPKSYRFLSKLLSGSFDEEIDSLFEPLGALPFSNHKAAYFFSTVVLKLSVGIEEKSWTRDETSDWLDNALPPHDLFDHSPSGSAL